MENTPTQLSERDSTVLSIMLLVGVIGLLGLTLDKYGGSRVEVVIKEPVATPSPFAEIELEASAAYVFDVNKEEALFSKNSETQLPLASLTKIMTALVAYESAPVDSVIAIEKESIDIEGDSGLSEGDNWLLSDLLGFTLLVSSNDGAHAVASAVESIPSDFEDEAEEETSFIDRMNSRASELGLVQTYFINETGLDPNLSISGGYGSARDTVELFRRAISIAPELLEDTAYSEVEYSNGGEEMLVAENTNEAVNSIPGLIASKTGFTDLAGGNLVIAFDSGLNHPIIITVLGSSIDGRFSDVNKLVSASIKAVGR
ncbi:MAG: hypothetical protein QF858_02640 [Candidatus Pacebacteria bacterium]|jgi:D-alanyl-D-alanine carboxypeptidase|nr:hypothetical protein [bacterium]MDP6527751.1 hypothetical protein [Candidatus Paceibacterota bacterium]MDP6659588.1 hypothetical protein [Candidatus Paceibacterota bacterium]|tara:strand:- start:21511 stop:22458 length:948 start_codon:yes stop_codon:yes gene_type:complete